MRAMSDQSDSDFASSNKIEKAGQDILQSLQKAADVAEASRETSRRLSHQLQNAENRIAELKNRTNSLLKNLEIGALAVFLPRVLERSGCCEQTLTYAVSSLGMRIRL